MRVRFLREVQYECDGRNKGPVYKKDSEHNFDDAFAQRWLRRGAAVVVEPVIAGVPIAKATPKATATKPE